MKLRKVQIFGIRGIGLLFSFFMRCAAAVDRLIVGELSRLCRSQGQVIQLVDELVIRKVRFTGPQGRHPLRGEAGLSDQGDDCSLRAFCGGRKESHPGTVKGGAGGRPCHVCLLGRERFSRHFQARRQRRRYPDAPGEKFSEASIAKILGESATNLRYSSGPESIPVDLETRIKEPCRQRRP